MRNVLNQNTFFVKEHLGFFKAANNYDIYDPGTGKLILECREESLSPVTKVLRFTGLKTLTPFDIEIREPGGKPLIRVQRGVAFFISKVFVFDQENKAIGSFRQKFFSIGGRFEVVDVNENPVCMLKGNLIGWNFKFTYNDKILAEVSKEWAGIGKEMFTTADNYVLTISEEIPADSPVRKLIIAAVMCIDMVLKEK